MKRLPTAAIMPLVNEYLGKYGTAQLPNEPNGIGPARILAERAGIRPDTFDAYMRGKLKTMDFDVVDRLLCAMGDPIAAWQGPLAEYYYAVDLSGPSTAPPTTYGPVRCARPGCDEMFVPSKIGHRYCSHYCADAARLKHRHREKFCRNNHPRSERNTIIEADGTRRCKTCRAENARKRYHERNPMAREYGPYAGRSVGAWA